MQVLIPIDVLPIADITGEPGAIGHPRKEVTNGVAEHEILQLVFCRYRPSLTLRVSAGFSTEHPTALKNQLLPISVC
jgi:hypothetical protein